MNIALVIFMLTTAETSTPVMATAQATPTVSVVATLVGEEVGVESNIVMMLLTPDEVTPTSVAAAPPVASIIECPAYPGDPPWRPITCWILSRLGEPPTRPPFEGVDIGTPVKDDRWE
ncbi:MAG: hypothetical protein HY420_04630 [Candidatus Kerfeldbacteria bacterium]|nr:hypothetical protein [Candidatus Kerfeldbacteria bacterium]